MWANWLKFSSFHYNSNPILLPLTPSHIHVNVYAKSNRLYIFIAFSVFLLIECYTLVSINIKILGKHLWKIISNLGHTSFAWSYNPTIQQIVQLTCFEEESLAVSSCSIMESTSRSLVMVKVYFFFKHEKFSHPSKKIKNIYNMLTF